MSQNVDLGQDKVVQFGGYRDHLFEIWLITEGGTYERIAGPALKPQASFAAITEDIRLAFVDASRSTFSLSVLGGHREVEFITGQRSLVTARGNDCGYNRQLVTYRGRVSPVVLPAISAAIEIPDGSDDVVCGEAEAAIAPSSENEVYPCRVPLPVATNDGARTACASPERLKFAFLDEYFRPRPRERVQYADFGVATNDAGEAEYHVAFRYTAPFCLRTVKVGPTDVNKRLRDVVHTQTGRSDWTGDEVEALLLEDPERIETDDIFGSTCVDNDRAIFVEDDEVTLKFELVEVYPLAGSSCEWPWDYETLCSLDIGDTATGFARSLSDVDPTSADAIRITYLDGLTGTDVMVDAATYEADPPVTYDNRVFEFRPGFRLEAIARDPSPFAPFVVDINVIFNRDYDGSYVSFDRRAIIVGTISEDVPQTITMTTDPTLIFMILRDPPGGT